MDDHQIGIIKQRRYPFKALWACVCGELMPKDVPFGIPLEQAFRDHLIREGVTP